jgi:DNA-binding transcriptional ArsR family regulator
VVSGPAFELIAELAAFASGPARASLESGKTWIREVRALAGAELLERVDRWAFGLYAELASVAFEAGPPYDPGRLVGALRALPPEVLRQRLLGVESVPNQSMVSEGAFDRALAGDPAARTELHVTLGPNRPARQSFDRLLTAAPEAVQADVVSIVEAWAERVFPAFSRDALPIVARDVVAKERQLATRSGRDVLRTAMHGVDVEPTPSVAEFVLVPTVAMRPFVAPVDWRSVVIFLCSVGDDAFDDDPSAPPRRLVKLTFALGDDTRLRILKVLAGSELTATEIADRLGVDRTSLHHHLGILRSAGLLRIHDDGLRGWRFARAAEGGDLAAALAEYLGTAAPD